ncbi:hypothetical protein CXF68_07830 [Tenacibaculum sp. Bg11-29]|uniref:hypothetical protein n=1 Tax=Tenacibaculum sp. Bg11-29 TaxID=2058306 RepID=UPI000C335152|nr:hypothetical protein [Tenacibaculum sp. Bg11-29]PKH50610.1 hypothetical protein CXF68_07830 [Tenacibaculum sp. Bg11-29]
MNFPDDFVDSYEGEIVINNSKGHTEIPIEFHLKKTSITNKYDYIIVYNKQPRNYTLIVIDKKKASIILMKIMESFYLLNFTTIYFIAFFKVQGNFLSSRLTFQKDLLNFEILFSATKNKIITGRNTSKKIPEVIGYPITTIQNALLI